MQITSLDLRGCSERGEQEGVEGFVEGAVSRQRRIEKV
jgi:hypothetical protein